MLQMTETRNMNHSCGCSRSEASTSAKSHKNAKPSFCGTVCGNDKTVSAGEAHDNLFCTIRQHSFSQVPQ